MIEVGIVVPFVELLGMDVDCVVVHIGGNIIEGEALEDFPPEAVDWVVEVIGVNGNCVEVMVV